MVIKLLGVLLFMSSEVHPNVALRNVECTCSRGVIAGEWWSWSPLGHIKGACRISLCGTPNIGTTMALHNILLEKRMMTESRCAAASILCMTAGAGTTINEYGRFQLPQLPNAP
ncbi:uncharacterized protein EDB93DRAFT_1165821 [Suillus bovinus]|uniref:uncharacterized protein n=1 Tax=Suillus bovinus TaxID=48563 RepID=UPI001B876802|nr:uncharacterized protein EDB93DRAFT_1165821 [Suillus bovinus]KAG2138061.1 hypothetical protein EDB93DRAFT_1165821 [Suillus bovinus]